MTEALTRLFQRTKKVDDPEYLPPYFWHRYWVWRYPIYFSVTVPAIITLQSTPSMGDQVPGVLGFLIALLVTLMFNRIPNLIRRAWANDEVIALNKHLSALHDSGKVENFSVSQDVVKLTLFREDLDRYSVAQMMMDAPISLSIRRMPWGGDGTRYAIYQRGRPKRTITFHHDP